MPSDQTSRPRTVIKMIIAVAVGIVLCAAAFWAGRVTTAPVTSPDPVPAEDLTVEVRNERLGQTLTLNTTITQEPRLIGVNLLTGIVTEVADDATFKVGSTVFRIGGTPVRVVAGKRPFWRDLSQGDKGSDVRQLRDALVALDYQDDSGDTFTAATARAVRAWQEDLGVPETGRIKLGTLIAVPDLPAALSIDTDKLVVGSRATGGEPVLFGRSGQPVFELIVSEDQAQRIPEAAAVSMVYQKYQWKAVVTKGYTDDSGYRHLVLAGADGGSVCGKDCAAIAPGETVQVLSQVTIVPAVTGPAVPVAALITTADGTTEVIVVASGAREHRTVTVKASADGMAVVEGVSPGERVQVLTGNDQSGPGGPKTNPSGSPSATKSPS